MLTELHCQHFRNLENAEIQPFPGINLLLGDNGSGKTSLLEAIYLLALGRSFRTRHLKNAVQFEKVQCQLFARIAPNFPVGLQYSLNSGLQIRLNNAPLKKISELAIHLPLQYISANCHQFFELGPKFRRKIVDWGLFHVEPDFLFHWQSYKKNLLQRNAAIRNAQSDSEISLWNSSLVRHGLIITELRHNYLNQLLISFTNWFTFLCEEFSKAKIELRYSLGWPRDDNFMEVLDRQLIKDKKLGYTRNGAHAADWSIKINDQDPAELLSRGQQKLFYLAICFSQVTLLQETRQQKSILLVDDISSELDINHQYLVMQAIESLHIQSFITSTDHALTHYFKSNSANQQHGLFHVKRGAIMRVS